MLKLYLGKAEMRVSLEAESNTLQNDMITSIPISFLLLITLDSALCYGNLSTKCFQNIGDKLRGLLSESNYRNVRVSGVPEIRTVLLLKAEIFKTKIPCFF